MIISEKICNSAVERIMVKRIENLYEHRKSENFDKISDYCDILLEANGSNIYAALYSVLANQSTSSFDDIGKFSVVTRAVQVATILAKDVLGTSEEYYDYCENAIVILSSKLAYYINSMFMHLRIVRQQYEKDPTVDQSVIAKNCRDLSSSISTAFTDVFKEVSDFYSEWLKNADPNTTPKKLVSSVELAINGLKSAAKSAESERGYINTRPLDDSIAQCKSLSSEIHKLAVERYWEAHSDEKAELEESIEKMKKEIEALESEKAKAQAEVDEEVSTEEEMFDILEERFTNSRNKLMEEINATEEEKSKQGFFSFGAKKDLKSRIQELQNNINTLEKDYSDKVREVEEKVDGIKAKGRTVSKGFSKKIADINIKIDDIKNDLENKEE